MTDVLIIAAIAVLAALNLAGFALSGYDKRAAKRRARRIPEKWFLILAFLGGGPGVLLSFYTIRHKTRHYWLLLGVWLGSGISIGLLLWLYFSHI